MIGAEREELRRRIDAARRELVARIDVDLPSCVGCGCLHEERSAGCNRCKERHGERVRRARRRAELAQSVTFSWLDIQRLSEAVTVSREIVTV